MDLCNEKLYRFADWLMRWLFPKHCPVCDEIIPLNEEYCHCSRQESRRISNDYCHHCGCDIASCDCDTENAVVLPEIAGVYVYSGKVRSDILDLKFNNCKRLAVKLGTDMAERCAYVYKDIDFDAVTFVPMTVDSYNKRTYNQSQLLANQVGKALFVPVEDLFNKIRQTRTQHELGGDERAQNVKASVELKAGASVEGKKVLICDDVKTTGATLNECVQALKKGGAEKICCICVAVTEFLR